MTSRVPAVRSLGLAATIYAVITALLFRQLFPVITTRLFGDLGDPLLNTSILAWNARVVPLSAEWWNFPGYAPLSGITAFTEHLLITYPIASPIIWATHNPVLAYNVLVVISLPLNGLAMWALGYELTASSLGALIGGLAFAFSPFQAEQLAHLQMLMAWGMPLALFGTHRYLRTGRPSDLVWFVIGWLGVLFSNAYMLVFFPILLGIGACWLVRRDNLGRAAVLVGVAAVASLPVLPLLLGYHTRQLAYGLTRSYQEILLLSADMRGLAGVSHRNVLWKPWLLGGQFEGSLFPGVAIVGLSLVGVAAGVRNRSVRPLMGFYACAVMVLWSLTLGPEPHWGATRLLPYGPYSLVLQVPGGQAIRVPARAWLPATIALAACAAFGAEWLRRSMPTGTRVVAIAAVLIVVEGWFVEGVVRPPLPSVEGAIPPRSLVLDLPVSEGYTNASAQFLAVQQGYRVINGYSGYAPPHFGPMRRALADHRDIVWDVFRRQDDVYVIVRDLVDRPFIEWLSSRSGARLVQSVGRTRLYHLPRLATAPTTHPSLPLPAPGAAALEIPE